MERTTYATLRPTTETKPVPFKPIELKSAPEIPMPKIIKTASKNAQPKAGNIVITISISEVANNVILKYFKKQGDKSRIIEEAIKQKYPEDYKNLTEDENK